MYSMYHEQLVELCDKHVSRSRSVSRRLVRLAVNCLLLGLACYLVAVSVREPSNDSETFDAFVSAAQDNSRILQKALEDPSQEQLRAQIKECSEQLAGSARAIQTIVQQSRDFGAANTGWFLLGKLLSVAAFAFFSFDLLFTGGIAYRRAYPETVKRLTEQAIRPLVEELEGRTQALGLLHQRFEDRVSAEIDRRGADLKIKEGAVQVAKEDLQRRNGELQSERRVFTAERERTLHELGEKEKQLRLLLNDIERREAQLAQTREVEGNISAILARLDGYAALLDDPNALSQLAGMDAVIMEALRRHRIGRPATE